VPTQRIKRHSFSEDDAADGVGIVCDAPTVDVATVAVVMSTTVDFALLDDNNSDEGTGTVSDDIAVRLTPIRESDSCEALVDAEAEPGNSLPERDDTAGVVADEPAVALQPPPPLDANPGAQTVPQLAPPELSRKHEF